MCAEYTVLVEYLDESNSCEIVSRRELVVVESESEDGACEHVRETIGAEGFSESEYRIVDVVEGAFDALDEFWDARTMADEWLAEQQRQYDEQLEWALRAEEQGY